MAPGDYLTHSIVPARLRELGVGMVVVDPSARYMEPEFRKELPELLNGLAGISSQRTGGDIVLSTSAA